MRFVSFIFFKSRKTLIVAVVEKLRNSSHNDSVAKIFMHYGGLS